MEIGEGLGGGGGREGRERHVGGAEGRGGGGQVRYRLLARARTTKLLWLFLCARTHACDKETTCWMLDHRPCVHLMEPKASSKRSASCS